MRAAVQRLGQHALTARSRRLTPTASGIDVIRKRGVLLVALLGWMTLFAVAGIQLALHRSMLLSLIVGLAANIAPTVVAWRGRHDREARMVVGTLAAIMPALLVYAFRGHEWQMDAHMYFFVALAALTVLCDWRPIALASVLIAVHHLAFELLAPAWVFNGNGDIARVLFHAVAVVLQMGVLAYVTTWLAELLRTQDRAVATSVELAASAQQARRDADAALVAATVANNRAEHQRALADKAEQRHDQDRRRELLSLAADFERSVQGVAGAIETAATELEASAAQLGEVSVDAGQQVSNVAANTHEATIEIRSVATAITHLGTSISSVAHLAAQQRELTELGRERTARSASTIAALSSRADQIGEFITEIQSIVGKTSLLALNARIEAARAGDAGAGFAVVAGEVKNLSAETAQASAKVVAILKDVTLAIAASSRDADLVHEVVDELSEAASRIAADAADQTGLASTIEFGAAGVAGNADTIEHRIAEVSASVTTAAMLSTQLRGSTSALSASVRQLRSSSELFVRHLRAPPPVPVLLQQVA